MNIYRVILITGHIYLQIVWCIRIFKAQLWTSFCMLQEL